MTFLQRSKARFSHGIVVAITRARHALPDAMSSQDRPNMMVHVLLPPFRVDNQPSCTLRRPNAIWRTSRTALVEDTGFFPCLQNSTLRRNIGNLSNSYKTHYQRQMSLTFKARIPIFSSTTTKDPAFSYLVRYKLHRLPLCRLGANRAIGKS
jgi:hypothetical protein